MDGTTLIIIVVIALPVLVIWALSKAAALRGPMPPARQGRESVELLVTDAVHEEPPEEDSDAEPRRRDSGL
jgi:hypothetical protein